MKKVVKILLILTIVISFLFTVSCQEKENQTIELDKTSYELYEGDIIVIEPIVKDLPNVTFIFEASNDNVLINNNEIKAVKEGKAEVTIYVKNSDIEPLKVTINVIKKIVFATSIETVENITLNKGETYQIEALVLPSEANQKIEYVVLDKDILSITSSGLITGIKAGETEVLLQTSDGSNVSINIKVLVIELATSIEFEKNDITLEVGSSYQIQAKALPLTASQELSFEKDSSDFIEISDEGFITTKKAGKTVVFIKTKDGSNIMKSINVTTVDTTKPVLELQEGYTLNEKIEIGKEFNPLIGIIANDIADGDITSKIICNGEVNVNKYGSYILEYTVEDTSGNKASLKRVIDIVWPYSVQFIGHAGSYYGLMNSEEAILYAVQVLKYQAVEVDLKQTKDGIFVLSHDDDFNGFNIASTNYSDLMNVTKTASRKAGIPGQNGSVTKDTYTTTICTLERFLEICHEYNVKAVIELKYSNGINNNDQSRMKDLMQVIRNKGMLENVIFLASQYNCLIWTRENGYEDIECQYLVNSCESETILQRCINYNLDVSINTTGNYSNSDEWLARYKENDLKVSTYTYTQYVDYDVVQKWIDKGVDYMTCDWHIMSKLTLPIDEERETYIVTFKDYDGNILKEAKVEEGRTAAAPQVPNRNGYAFIGWDKSISNVKDSFEVTAQYEIINYTITYVDNLTIISESKWPSKEDFVNEFYNDLLMWFKENGSNIEGITLNNETFTLTKNGVTVSFKTVEDILCIDIYDFEKTISNYIYKPVVRNSDDSAIIEASENYFLNSEKYLEKYRDLDRWFINCINTSYSSYDKTYKPTASGKIQIMFRFHQWAKGTNIAAFNVLPKRYEVEKSDISVTLPKEKLTYTFLDEFILPEASSEYEFLGWYTDKEGTGEKVERIAQGTTGNIILYAKWEI